MWFSWIKDPTTNFPYEIGDIVAGLEEKSFWVLHKGKRKVSHRSYKPFHLFSSFD